jgi:transposase
MPGGRPTKYKPEFCEMLIKHMEQGYSFESFAATIDTHRGTLYNWEKEHTEFLNAKKIGLDKSLLWWERLGAHGAAGKVKGFNPAAWVFSVKNKHQWRDKTPDEIKEEAKPLIIVKPSTGEREFLTNTRAVEQLEAAGDDEDE